MTLGSRVGALVFWVTSIFVCLFLSLCVCAFFVVWGIFLLKKTSGDFLMQMVPFFWTGQANR